MFNYLQRLLEQRRDISEKAANVDGSVIESVGAERSDSCDRNVVSAKRLRHVRQTKALLSIISSTSAARTKDRKIVITS